jgi:hypothetical protein
MVMGFPAAILVLEEEGEEDVGDVHEIGRACAGIEESDTGILQTEFELQMVEIRIPRKLSLRARPRYPADRLTRGCE